MTANCDAALQQHKSVYTKSEADKSNGWNKSKNKHLQHKHWSMLYHKNPRIFIPRQLLVSNLFVQKYFYINIQVQSQPDVEDFFTLRLENRVKLRLILFSGNCSTVINHKWSFLHTDPRK